MMWGTLGIVAVVAVAIVVALAVYFWYRIRSRAVTLGENIGSGLWRASGIQPVTPSTTGRPPT